MPNYTEMNFKMVRATEQAFEILIAAQRECKEPDISCKEPELNILFLLGRPTGR